MPAFPDIGRIAASDDPELFCPECSADWTGADPTFRPGKPQ
jgi:hypothetical protein